MNSINQMYEQLIEEIKQTKIKSNQSKENKEQSEKKYNETNAKINEIDKQLNWLYKIQEKLPYKNHKKIRKISAIISSIVFILSSLLYISISYKTIFPLFSLELIDLSIKQYITIGLFSIIGPIGAITEIKLFQKIKENLLIKSYDKIEQSEEYQNIIKRIDKLNEEKESLKETLYNQEKELKRIKEVYEHELTEIKMKEALLSYINKNKNEEQTETQTKTYTKVKTK